MDQKMDQKQQMQLWLDEQAKLKSRDRHKAAPADDQSVNINSLMDAVTIILIFLLMNFSADPMKVTPHEKLQLPNSTTQLIAREKTVTLTVAADQILVNDTPVLTVKNNEVDSVEADKLEIPPLKAHLDEVVNKTKALNAQTGQAFKDVITIIVHGETHYRLVQKVIFTAGISSFTKFKFAVVKGGQIKQTM